MVLLKEKMLCVVAALLLCAMASGCMPVMRLGVGMAHPAIDNIEASLFQQNNLDLAERGLPGTIMLLEGILANAPNDLLLQVVAVKAYLGLGMLIEDKSPAEATALYTRGTEWGMKALKQHRGFRKALEEGKNMVEAAHQVKSQRFVPALLWTAACMGSCVLLNIDDPMIAVDLGAVNALANQACALNDVYFHGFAYLFVGTVNSILPAAFGGDRQRAESAFKTLSTLNEDKFLLSKVFYAKFFLTDAKLSKEIMQGVADSPDKLMPDIELMNQIAKAKARHYIKVKESM